MNIRKYCIFIISYKRAEICKNHTFKMLKSINSCKAPIYIVCSDDDPTLNDYYNIYGKENVCVFNKLDVQKRFNIDLCDCYYGENNKMQGTVWVRNACYELAEKLGFEYFLVLDDDYILFNSRFICYDDVKKKNILGCLNNIFNYIDFDDFSNDMFNIIDSQPYISCVGYAHPADYSGGLYGDNFKKGIKFKVINVFFLSTNKKIKFIGRMNDDINTFLVNNNIGRLFLTLFDICVIMLKVREVKGGMFDLYKKFNSWMQEFYTVVCNPTAVRLGIIGKLNKNNNRIRHKLMHNRFVPKIINEKYCKNEKIEQTICYETNLNKEYKLDDFNINKLNNIIFMNEENQNLDDIF